MVEVAIQPILLLVNIAQGRQDSRSLCFTAESALTHRHYLRLSVCSASQRLKVGSGVPFLSSLSKLLVSSEISAARGRGDRGS